MSGLDGLGWPEDHILDADAACDRARRSRLNTGLRNLAEWCLSRAETPHNDETTLTMLEKKVGELRAGINKAGWKAYEEFLQDRQ